MNPIRLSFKHGEKSLHQHLFGAGTTSRRVMAAVTAFILVSTGLVYSISEAFVSQAELTSYQAALIEKSNSNVAKKGEQKRRATPEQRRAWNSLVSHLNFPWILLLDSFERTLPSSIALISIEPDAQQESIRVQFESKRLDELLTYASSLRTGHSFKDVHLVRHETNVQDVTRPVRLTVDLKFDSAQFAPHLRQGTQ